MIEFYWKKFAKLEELFNRFSKELSLLTNNNVEIEEKENMTKNSEQNTNLGDIVLLMMRKRDDDVEYAEEFE